MTEPTWSLSLCLCAVHTLHNCFSSTQQLGASCDSYALIPFYSPLHLLNPTIWASSLLLEPDRHTPTSGPVSTTPTSLSRLYIRFTPSPASGLCSNATFTVRSSQTPYLKLCSVLISSLLFSPLSIFKKCFPEHILLKVFLCIWLYLSPQRYAPWRQEYMYFIFVVINCVSPGPRVPPAT